MTDFADGAGPPDILLETMPNVASAAAAPWASFGVGHVTLQIHRNGKACWTEIRDGHRIQLFGYALTDEDPSPQAVGALVRRGDDGALARINGEFLILHSPPGGATLRVITCRYGYPALWFHADGGRVRASTNFRRLCETLAASGDFQIDSRAFYDLLHYKRVFGDKTPARNVRLLRPAQVVEITPAGVTQRAYWWPDFRRKSRRTLDEAATALADGLVRAVQRRTQDSQHPGLFLTGGLDSRLILAAAGAAGRPVTGLTVNVVENREVSVAAQAANLAGMDHRFIQIPEQHYADSFQGAVTLTGGMYLPMPLLYGLGPYLPQGIDMAFHGHGLDYFFQGLYLPTRSLHLFGKRLDWRRPRPIQGSLVDDFLASVSYKTKGLDVQGILHPQAGNQQRQRLQAELAAVAAEAYEICLCDEDILDYLSFHNLARHYSCGDHWGINTAVEQRTVAFDNDLYDLYQSLPPEHRFDGRIARRALEILNPALAQLASANSTYPIHFSSAERTIHQVLLAAARRLGLAPAPPDNWWQRSGLPMGHLLAKVWRPLVEDLRDSDRLEALDFLDSPRVRRLAMQTLDSPNPGYNTALLSLITIDQFLAQSPQ